MKILVIDVGGTNVKVALSGNRRRIKIPSGRHMTPQLMVAEVKKATAGWKYDRISIGYPGPVRRGRPIEEPKNLGPGWTRFNFDRAFPRPVKLVNDAAMQALGGYRGGRMLFLGLGTGLGAAAVLDGVLQPLELAHLPYRHGKSYEDFVGVRGLKRLGRSRWEGHVRRIVAILMHGLQVDYAVIGGGNAKKLERAPLGARLTTNKDAIEGGIRLWAGPSPPAARAGRRRVRRSRGSR